jgi:hypothetical protein
MGVPDVACGKQAETWGDVPKVNTMGPWLYGYFKTARKCNVLHESNFPYCPKDANRNNNENK